jgi:predicted phosphoribosyltransferase
MRFRDRTDAGRKLAAALLSYRNQHPIILALPRGGVPVAAEVAKALRASLDIILVRKIGAPVAPELAVGAVVDGASPTIVSNPEIIRLTGTSEMQFQRICKEELAEIERRRHLFLGNRPPIDPRGRVVIVIDDGIATGATTRAALRAIRTRQPKKLVLAVPVGATNAINELRDEVDDVICLEKLEPFGSVGYFYSDFRQLTDQDVIEILDRFSPTDTAANK